MANVLVTGGAGFIGAELAHQLVLVGHRVTVVDNLINGKCENLVDLEGQTELAIVDKRGIPRVITRTGNRAQLGDRGR